MAVKLSPLFNDAQLDASGNPLSGGKLYTYAAGSTTAQTAYQDSGGVTPHANPIVLNSRGEPPAPIWLTSGQTYKFDLQTAAAVSIRTIDNVSGVNDTSVSVDQWVSGPAPTYIGATSFSLAGDQTSTFHVGRRVKTTNSGGTVYSTIAASAYAAVTTVTVVNDSGTLDSGLSAVAYGLLSATDPSTPLLADTYPIVSGSADKTKKVRFEVDGLTSGTTRVVTVPDRDLTIGPVLVAEVASTSGTSIDFTGIPAGTKRITVMFKGVSLNGTSDILIQIGDSGGIEATGYLGSGLNASDGATCSVLAYTTGFGLKVGNASAVLQGAVTLTLENSANFTWVAAGNVGRSDGNVFHTTAGVKSTSAELDRVRITTANGTDTFDAGAISISYE